MGIWQDPRSLPPSDWDRVRGDCQRDGIPAADSPDPLKTGILRKDMDESRDMWLLGDDETANTKRLK